MKEKHIILRTPHSATRDVFLGPLSGVNAFGSVTTISVDVAEIDRKDVVNLTMNSGVRAVAPSVPMRLVAPLDVMDTAGPLAGASAWGVSAVGADTSPFTGDGIVVAVLDTGIDADHPAFSGVEIIQKDFTGEGNGDSHGHGTHCAGTIFGRATAGARIGVAPGVRKALIGKVLGQDGGSSESIVSAIQWAVENGANVISMSLGMDFPGLQRQLTDRGFPAKLATSRALEGYRLNVKLFESLASLIGDLGAFGRPAILVAAAGNESDRDTNPDFEIAVSPPAVAEGVVSVAALGQSAGGLTVASFSNTGANVSGPGVAIVSAKRGGGFATMSGTSMATPHVAGVAALWAEQIKSIGVLTPRLLTNQLVASATGAGLAPGFDPFDVGAGLVRAPQA